MVNEKLLWAHVASPSFCAGYVTYANRSTTLSGIEGIGVYSQTPPCSWTLQPTSRCLDLIPPSDDCASPTACN